MFGFMTGGSGGRGGEREEKRSPPASAFSNSRNWLVTNSEKSAPYWFCIVNKLGHRLLRICEQAQPREYEYEQTASPDFTGNGHRNGESPRESPRGTRSPRESPRDTRSPRESPRDTSEGRDVNISPRCNTSRRGDTSPRQSRYLLPIALSLSRWCTRVCASSMLTFPAGCPPHPPLSLLLAHERTRAHTRSLLAHACALVCQCG